MAKKYFAQDVKTSSEFTYKIKNIEMMKSAKSSKNPTLNYQLKGRDFIRFWNYEIYLSLVKAYTDMKFVICDECKCKSQPPSSIIDGISSYQCFEELEEVIKNCQHCKDTVLYPYGKFVNQGIEEDPCFKFPRRITNDPCVKPPPCPPHVPRVARTIRDQCDLVVLNRPNPVCLVVVRVTRKWNARNHAKKRFL